MLNEPTNKVDFLEEFLYLEKTAEIKLDRRNRDVTPQKFELFLKIESEEVKEFISKHALSITQIVEEDYFDTLKALNKLVLKQNIPWKFKNKLMQTMVFLILVETF